jgi:hypothetical protein
MPFTKQNSIVPTSIGRISVTLIDDPTAPPKQAVYHLVVLDQNGNRIPIAGDEGDLAPYLTTTQINQLMAFMDGLRTQATNQIIG